MKRRSIDLFMALYPRAWRSRYEEEFRALLESEQLSLKTGVNLVWSAFGQHVQTSVDWMMLASAVGVIAAMMTMWYMPVSASCTSIGAAAASCHTQHLLPVTGTPWIVLTPIMLALSAVLGTLVFHLRRSRAFLIVFGLTIMVFFVVSFGLDWALLPTGLLSLASAAKTRIPH